MSGSSAEAGASSAPGASVGSSPVDAEAPASPRGVRAAGFSPLAVGGAASLGAGAIHAAAVGAHSEHRQAVIAFSVLALLQLGWGAVALVRSGRLLAALGIVVNSAAIGGWVMAKTSGISFVDGLGDAESVQWADALAAGLAAVAVVVALRGLVVRTMAGDRGPAAGPRRWALTSLGVAITAVALVGMVAAGSPSHAGGHGHDDGETAHGHDDGHDDGAADGHAHDAAASSEPGADDGPTTTHAHGPAPAVPPKPYDPTKPIDLSGVEGVTPEQQARAENMIAITLIRLPRFADHEVAEAEGYHSIGDASTGHEHFINWDLLDDGRILDPDHPESLVYEPQPDGSRKLVSAMFMLEEGTTLDDVPDLGGKLTQWHIHDNLCFSDDPEAPVVAGIRASNGPCPGNLQAFTPVPMIHVWITKHPCGPFAALEGVGAGQIKEGETRLCDHAHGA